MSPANPGAPDGVSVWVGNPPAMRGGLIVNRSKRRAVRAESRVPKASWDYSPNAAGTFHPFFFESWRL